MRAIESLIERIQWERGWAESDGLAGKAKIEREHATACVQAIESIGGDPEKVTAMHKALKAIQQWLGLPDELVTEDFEHINNLVNSALED